MLMSLSKRTCGLLLVYLVGLAMGVIFGATFSRLLWSNDVKWKYHLNLNLKLEPVKPKPQPVENFEISNDKLIFISFSPDSLQEIAILTKLAQALYPVRDKVVWIVVSEEGKELRPPGSPLPLLKDSPSSSAASNANFTNRNSSMLDKQRRRLILEKRLKRFGIPIVLLTIDNPENDPLFKMTRELMFQKISKQSEAFAKGLLWAAKEFKGGGVVMFGHEEYTYNYDIFKKILLKPKTKIASVWPTGLTGALGFSAPIYNKTLKHPVGFHNGDGFERGDITLQNAAFAVDMDYIRQKLKTDQMQLLDLADEEVSFSSFGIPLEKVDYIDANSSKILVWRTRSHFAYFPKSITVKKYNYSGTNMALLWENLFRQRVDYIPIHQNRTDKRFRVYL